MTPLSNSRCRSADRDRVRRPSRGKAAWAGALFGSLAAWLLAAAAAHGSPADDAARILQATGIKGGLVVHLGCGDGRLTAALRAGDAYVVHGLDADAANIEKAARTSGRWTSTGPSRSNTGPMPRACRTPTTW